MEELGPYEIIEHEGADRDVHAGQSLHLSRCQLHAGHLEVFGTYPVERLPIWQCVHSTVQGGSQAAVECRFSEGRDPTFSKPFPPDLSTRLSARHAPSGCPKQPNAVYTFAS